MFKQYCANENIQHVLCTTDVPRSNGQVERANRTIIPILSKLSAPKPKEKVQICRTGATIRKCISESQYRLISFRVIEKRCV